MGMLREYKYYFLTIICGFFFLLAGYFAVLNAAGEERLNEEIAVEESFEEEVEPIAEDGEVYQQTAPVQQQVQQTLSYECSIDGTVHMTMNAEQCVWATNEYNRRMNEYVANTTQTSQPYAVQPATYYRTPVYNSYTPPSFELNTPPSEYEPAAFPTMSTPQMGETIPQHPPECYQVGNSTTTICK